ncbi:MAG: nucleotide exchange factor GrpE [Epulopiscium sp. Nuni2H_MBin003]|nr:MAG: nucleotide exchange factor GrpE [Epulopiscium sp. Nuni2H_MBin003]
MENENIEPIEEEIQEEEIQEEEIQEEEIQEEEEIVAEESKQDSNLEKLQRLMAEFDNYRKRTEKEKAQVYDMALSGIVTEMLGTLDNFERALQQETSDKAFYEGVMMIYKQLVGVIEKIGVTAIETVGKEFDPNFHNAIFHVEDETVGKNTIIEEMQKGYIYKEKVLRHSLVKVAN